jgi:hypothetical protein
MGIVPPPPPISRERARTLARDAGNYYGSGVQDSKATELRVKAMANDMANELAGKNSALAHRLGMLLMTKLGYDHARRIFYITDIDIRSEFEPHEMVLIEDAMNSHILPSTRDCLNSGRRVRL